MIEGLRLHERSRLAREYCFYLRTCKNWRTIVRARRKSVPVDRFESYSGAVITFANDPPWNMFGDIWRDQIYTRPPIRLHPKPNVIVDIGANLGFFTLFAASRWPNASIHAYEPAPDNFLRLMRNVELSGADYVVCHSLAVSSTAGSITLYLKRDTGWHSIWNDGAQSAITVNSTTLDAILDELGGRSIDLLKIDCEGAEYEILTGRESLLAERVHQVAMEYHEVGHHGGEELVSLFRRAGFAVTKEPKLKWHTGMLYALNQNVLARQSHR